MKLLIATLLPLAVLAAGFETGVVAPSDGGSISIEIQFRRSRDLAMDS